MTEVQSLLYKATLACNAMAAPFETRHGSLGDGYLAFGNKTDSIPSKNRVITQQFLRNL